MSDELETKLEVHKATSEARWNEQWSKNRTQKSANKDFEVRIRDLENYRNRLGGIIATVAFGGSVAGGAFITLVNLFFGGAGQ